MSSAICTTAVTTPIYNNAYFVLVMVNFNFPKLRQNMRCYKFIIVVITALLVKLTMKNT
jgi:hypothetical protein